MAMAMRSITKEPTNPTRIRALLMLLRYKDANAPTPEEVDRRKRFLEKLPDQEANILTLQSNAACKCAADIVKAMVSYPEGIDALITLITGKPAAEFMPPFSAIGTTITIENTDEAWAALMADLIKRQAMYRGITAVPTADGKLKLYIY